MILVGDIGGTNTRLALYEQREEGLRPARELNYKSRDHASLDEMVLDFVTKSRLPVERACFGVAGPVKDGRISASNLAWIVDSRTLARILHLDRVYLLNDLQAIAYGVMALSPGDTTVLRKGQPAEGNRAVIAAGTGLGEAGLFWDGARLHPFASEGGHADFAPRNQLEIELFGYLYARFGHVSYERILSGPGLVNVYQFLRDTGRDPEPAWLAEEFAHADPGAVISRFALAGKSPLCEHALDLFIDVYGAEAGNCALRFMAVNGIFIAGGIAPKILPIFSGPRFLAAFTNKGRLNTLLESIPVSVVTNEKVGLLGSAHYATAVVEEPLGTSTVEARP
ncbi:MAG TPA: glucokinase [Terriglobales bacterium]|nr:glucokinase [Terriglobales bacterium]